MAGQRRMRPVAGTTSTYIHSSHDLLSRFINANNTNMTPTGPVP